MSKQWRSGGEEDKFVINLIKDGKVTKKTSAADLKSWHPTIFGEFNDQVVRNHLHVLKLAKGLLRKFSFHT
jgi:hypothetical protein